MEELIKSSKEMLEGLKAEHDSLQEAFKAETDVNKMDALDTQISQIGKDIVTLESKVTALEVATKKSSFDPSRLAALTKVMSEHAQETSQAIKGYVDSIAGAKYLASRVASGAKLVGNALKMIA